MDLADKVKQHTSLYLLWVVGSFGPFRTNQDWTVRAGAPKGKEETSRLGHYIKALKTAGLVTERPYSITEAGWALLKKYEAEVPSALPAGGPTAGIPKPRARKHRVSISETEPDYTVLAEHVFALLLRKLSEPPETVQDDSAVKDLTKTVKALETALRASENNLKQTLTVVQQLTRENDSLKDSLQNSGSVRVRELLDERSKATLDGLMKEIPRA